MADAGSKLGHSFSKEYHSDDTYHYYECACGARNGEGAHVSSGATTATNDEVCTVCGYVIHPAAGILFNTLSVSGNTVYGKVSADTATFSFVNEIRTVGGAKYVISRDVEGTQTIPSKTISLSVGDNTVFLTEYIDDEPVAFYTVTVRRRPTYTVTFDTNGGTPIEAITAEEDTVLTAPECARVGYTFAGWDYDFSEPITAPTVITAGWNAIAYHITYELNGGTNASGNPATYTVEDAITLTNPTRTNYTFICWCSDEALTQEITQIEKGSTGAMTVYAKWEYGTEGLKYSLSSGGYTVSGYTGTAAEVIIPEKHLGAAVTGIGSSAFSGCTGLTSITIPASVTSIGMSAFSGCTGLTGITIPASVTSIGMSAFSGCTGLTTVYWNAENCTEAGDSRDPIFGNCSALNSIVIGNNVKTIPSCAFYGCKGLTSIGDFAFSGCSKLTSITIPSSVTSIGPFAFYGCTGLTSITFQGTKAQWNGISKGGNWNSNTGAYVIRCSDGEIAK